MIGEVRGFSHVSGAEISKVSVRSNNYLSNGLKSRPGNYPYAPVVQGSGVLVTGGRKFPIGKAAGRNASEPGCSLVKLMETPTRWTHGESRCSRAWITEAAREVFRGSRGGMLRKISSAVLEARCGDAGGASTDVYKETKSRWPVTGVGGVHSTV